MSVLDEFEGQCCHSRILESDSVRISNQESFFPREIVLNDKYIEHEQYQINETFINKL